MAEARRGTCPECGRRYPLRRDGSVQGHNARGVPALISSRPAPWAECAGSGRTATEHANGGSDA